MDDSAKDRLDQAFANIGIYDRQGRRISYSEFSRLREDLAYRFLARDKVGDLEVVTAWLGMDQSDADQPCIFGTVTLAPDGSLVDEREIYASTEAEATAHYAEVLARRKAEHEASNGDSGCARVRQCRVRRRMMNLDERRGRSMKRPGDRYK